MNILVTAATGTVGTHVVRALRERGVTPRAFVRDPEQAALALGKDVELVVGDFADRDSIDRAMRGTDRLFLACGNVPDQVARECAAIDAAKAAGVARVVKLSGPRAAVDSPLLFERWHGEIERHLLASGLPAVLLRPHTYQTNLLANAETIKQIGTLFAPPRPRSPSWIRGTWPRWPPPCWPRTGPRARRTSCPGRRRSRTSGSRRTCPQDRVHRRP